MDHMLSLSQAARMVGVPRKVLQQQIQAGELSTFEGYLRTSELLKLYPDAQADNSGMLEKVRLIQLAAASKDMDNKQDPERLSAELHRLKIQLALVEGQRDSYRMLADDMTGRLLELQESCDKQQSMVLGTLIGWYMHQVKLRESN